MTTAPRPATFRNGAKPQPWHRLPFPGGWFDWLGPDCAFVARGGVLRRIDGPVTLERLRDECARRLRGQAGSLAASEAA